jgi:hypothetical protein
LASTNISISSTTTLETVAPSQQGITDIEIIVISLTSYLRFKTTNFNHLFLATTAAVAASVEVAMEAVQCLLTVKPA